MFGTLGLRGFGVCGLGFRILGFLGVEAAWPCNRANNCGGS